MIMIQTSWLAIFAGKIAQSNSKRNERIGTFILRSLDQLQVPCCRSDLDAPIEFWVDGRAEHGALEDASCS